MKMMDIEQSCFECSHFRFNSLIKAPSVDGYDCLASQKRVLDMHMIRDKNPQSVMVKLYPPYGIPEFCPVVKDMFVDSKEEMEFV